MAATGSVTISGTVTGLATGQKTISPTTITAATAVGTIQYVTLAPATFQAVTIPTGATCVIIQPPSGNSQTLKLKAVTGDQGIDIHKTYPTLVSFDTGATALGLLSAGTVTGIELTWV
jgi:hypothetical protein